MPARGGAQAHENTPIGAGHARDTQPSTLTGPWSPVALALTPHPVTGKKILPVKPQPLPSLSRRGKERPATAMMEGTP
jgi:hypothetical protein